MSEQYPDSALAVENLLRNRIEAGLKLGIPETKHTPPAAGHYPHVFLWDSCFAAIINARHGDKRSVQSSQDEITTVIEGQDSTGFIPNMTFAQKGRAFDPERLLAFGSRAKGSNYSQPPVLALPVSETYQAMLRQQNEHEAASSASANNFLTMTYPHLKNFYDYFDKFRSNGPDDKLIGVIHPHETGRDSDPTFDFIKPLRLPRQGVETPNLIDKLNAPLDYLQIIAHGIRLRKANGNSQAARETFWVNDVMMNCIYADNLKQMSELASKLDLAEDTERFMELSRQVEQQILSQMWQPEARQGDGAFYALGKDGRPIDEVSVSNLFPLVLSGLHPEQLESLLNMMDKAFDTPYPLASVATDSPNFDPHNRETDRLWRGPTWINTNWYIVGRGLRMQAARRDLASRPDLLARSNFWAEKVVTSSKQLVSQGMYEHYNPITGKGQRPRVQNFGWSNLAYVM